ncbi:MAG: hypothetical protein KGL39_01585 [Patescibacteria group bacterium]|nr:hypothetical protein [Patescibacteria group bacterium]
MATETKDTKDEKVQRLVDAISGETSRILEEKFGQMEQEQAKIAAQQEVVLQGILARLDAIETMVSKPSGTKASVKMTAAEKKTGGAAKKAAAGGDDERNKVVNAQHYFKWACVNDPDFRERYLTEDRLALIEGMEFKKKDGDELIKAKAHAIWIKLKDEQAVKDEIKSEFDKWKADRDASRADTEELKEDAPAEEAGDGAAEEAAEPEAEAEEEPASKKPAPKAAAPKAAAPKKPAPKAEAKAAPEKAKAAPKAEAKTPAPKKAAAAPKKPAAKA